VRLSAGGPIDELVPDLPQRRMPVQVAQTICEGTIKVPAGLLRRTFFCTLREFRLSAERGMGE
jgi:hypothetical protein